MIVIPRAAARDLEIARIVIRRAGPLPNIAHHIVTTERAHAAAKSADWGSAICTEFSGIASRCVNVISPREKSIVGTACGVLPFGKRW